MSEVYEAGELYERSRRVDSFCRILFWANCVLTILSFWPNMMQPVVAYCQIATAVLHVGLSLADDCSLWFEAESANRKHLVEDAFGVDITNKRGVGY